MYMAKIAKLIINKSQFHYCLNLIILILLVFTMTCLIPVFANTKKEAIDVVIVPKFPSVGDTVVVKIAKDKNVGGVPKIFFDGTKYPVFLLSNEWYRSFVPLSANYRGGKYVIEVFYKGKAKKIDLLVNETKYPLQELTLPKTVAGLMASRIERVLVNKALSVYSPEKLWSEKFIYPSTGHQSTPYGVKEE